MGEVRPIEPSGFAIVRGMPASGGVGPFPSDHLVLPLEWKNASGSSVIMRRPQLVFSELGENGKPNGKPTRFFLAGEYPNISGAAFSEPYSYKNAFKLDPHSVSANVLVFRVERWWDLNQRFAFDGDTRYEVRIEFLRAPGRLFGGDEYAKEDLLVAEEFHMVPSVDDLERPGRTVERLREPWWNYWSFDDLDEG